MSHFDIEEVLTSSCYDYIDGPPTPHQGVVRRNPKIGQQQHYYSPKIYHDPVLFEQVFFKEGIVRLGKGPSKGLIHDEWFDFDKEYMRVQINNELSKSPVMISGVNVKGFLIKDALNRCIAESERTNTS